MSADTASEGLRGRITRQGEDALGRLAQDILENPLISGAISRAFDAREKAWAAQEAAMGALNIPSAGDVERLTRRLRSVSQRLEGIEDAVERLDERLASVNLGATVEQRLSTLDERLKALDRHVRGLATSRGVDERLTALENQITALGAELARLREALPAETEPLPREQERLQVGDAGVP